ncbi:arylsulfatase A-like enzyme [Anseongella ginsenosidimutans]|uniref:Arylsulfatase A-like enzyme n=2 Tax=Anseongella ginsenosidimutans TaxID=496056 RepID=A0A4R3KZ00_9SPHI|nr:arylsulfatase A-like enzyme [Anseongella ginsenosidimutans]
MKVSCSVLCVSGILILAAFMQPLTGQSTLPGPPPESPGRPPNSDGPPPESPGPERPNIIFLLTDDHRWDGLGAMGNSIIQTPNLDRLARRGLLFRNAYVTTAICAVSRASILSGQYMSRHSIRNFSSNFTQEALAKTYPLLLKKAGYTIGFAGKYGVGNEPPGELFDFWSCTEKGQPPYEYETGAGRTIHHTDSIGNDIREFLNEFAGRGGKPFCLSVSFKAPHELDGNPPTYPVQERFRHLYAETEIPLPETADPRYWNSFPDFFRTDKNIARKRWKALFSTPEQYQENVKNYYRLITGVDEVVGGLVQQLKDLGIDKNTVIIFMGDNGFYLGEHGLEGKWYGHEESIRVPLVIYDPRPGRKPGTPDLIALNIDIAPTILGIAGVPAPGTMQGKDLALMVETPRLRRNDFFYEHTFMGSPGIPKVEGVVSREIKYMNFIEHGYEELYDLRKDPKEKVNLAGDPRAQDMLQLMRTRYQELKKQAK